MEYDELVYACALNRIFNFNCKEARTLTEKCLLPSDIFALHQDEILELTGSPKLAEAFGNPYILKQAEAEVVWAKKHGIHILYIKDKEYPSRLRDCPDAPTVLFYRGVADLNPKRAISIVGTRRATPYGLRICRQIVESLSQLGPPPAIISGLAFGIDICAHTSAMEFGLDTIAVLPNGMDTIYPKQHRPLALEILNRGALVTDFHIQSQPQNITFIRRNRIIAGMADAVLLIESDVRGGGLITANLAHSYSREVLAVPGRITDKYSSGCNALIRKNVASIIDSPDAPARLLGWRKSRQVKLKDRFEEIFEHSDYIKRNILLALSADLPLDRNTLIDKAGGDPVQVLPRITELEMDGLIVSDLYGNYRLKH